MVGVDASAEEGGCTTWPEGARTQELRGDARDGFEELGLVTEGVGDELRFHGVPAVVVRVVIEVAVDRGVRGGPAAQKAQGNAA